MPSIIRATTTSGLQVAPDNSGSLQLQTNGTTTAVTIDTSQNVGIGTTSPTALLTIGASSGTPGYNINFTGSPPATIAGQTANTSTGELRNFAFTNYFPTFYSNNTERMRIDSSGNLLIGTTSSYGFGNLQLESTAGTISIRNSTATAGRYWRIGPDTSSNNLVVYNQNGTGVFLANGGTSWNSSSDETLKENLEPITDAINKINTLRAVTGNFITDEEKKKHPFLIAQDVEKVLPEAISESSDGTLGLAYTDVIPLLTAAIQEQQTIINNLKARIETLEAK